MKLNYIANYVMGNSKLHYVIANYITAHLWVHPIDITEHGSHTTLDKELVSVLEDISRAWGSNTRPLNLRSVTLPTLQRALLAVSTWTISSEMEHLYNWPWPLAILEHNCYKFIRFMLGLIWDVLLFWCYNCHANSWGNVYQGLTNWRLQRCQREIIGCNF